MHMCMYVLYYMYVYALGRHRKSDMLKMEEELVILFPDHIPRVISAKCGVLRFGELALVISMEFYESPGPGREGIRHGTMGGFMDFSHSIYRSREGLLAV